MDDRDVGHNRVLDQGLALGYQHVSCDDQGVLFNIIFSCQPALHAVLTVEGLFRALASSYLRV